MSSHAEIAAALTRLYQFFVKIGYITEEEMKWPPHDSQTLDRDSCRAHGYSVEAIALLEAIPCTTSYAEFGPGSDFVDYTSEEDLKCCRHPEDQNEEADEEMNPLLDGWMVTLAMHSVWGGQGEAYIVDANEGQYH